MRIKTLFLSGILFFLSGCGSPTGKVQELLDTHPQLQAFGYPFKVVKEKNGIITLQGPDRRWYGLFMGRVPYNQAGTLGVGSNSFANYMQKGGAYNGAMTTARDLARSVEGVKDVVWTFNTKVRG